MSAFSPVDPRDPMNRRKQLVQKLMAQYQKKIGPAPGRGAVPALGGRPAHGAGGGRAFAHPGITNGSNVVSSLLSRLGPGGAGLPLPGEMSPGPGMAAPDSGPHSAPMVPVDAPAPPAPVGAPVDPGFGHGPASPPPPAASGALVGAATPDQSPPPPAAAGGLVNAAAPASSPYATGGNASSNLIPLGGGVYYDIVNDTIHGTGGFG